MIKSSVLNFVREKAAEAKAYVELHEQLREVASQDQLIKANTAKIEQLNKERDAAEGKIKSAQAALAAIHQQQEEAKLVTEQTKAALAKHVENVEKVAQATVAAANDHAERSRRETQDKVTSAQVTLAALDEQVGKVRGDLESKKSEYAELQKQHADLQRKHQALQAGLAALSPNL